MLRWISILLRVHLQHLFLCQHLLVLRETEWQGWWELHNCLCAEDKECLTFKVKSKSTKSFLFLNTTFILFIFFTFPFFPVVSEWHNLFRCREDMTCLRTASCFVCELLHRLLQTFLFFYWLWQKFFAKGSNMRSWTRKCLVSVYLIWHIINFW